MGWGGGGGEGRELLHKEINEKYDGQHMDVLGV